MKYNDTYSMIGAMINQGFEVEFKKEREKKEKRQSQWATTLSTGSSS